MRVCVCVDRQKLRGAREEFIDEQHAHVLEDVPLRPVHTVTVIPHRRPRTQPFKYTLLLLSVMRPAVAPRRLSVCLSVPCLRFTRSRKYLVCHMPFVHSEVKLFIKFIFYSYISYTTEWSGNFEINSKVKVTWNENFKIALLRVSWRKVEQLTNKTPKRSSAHSTHFTSENA